MFHGFIKNYARQYRRFREKGSDRDKMLHKENPGHANSFLVYHGVFPTVSDTLKYIIMKSFSVFMLTVTVADI